MDGTLLQSAVPGGSSVPDGTEIAVSYDATPLYSYTVEGNSPSVIASGSQNTGYEAFSHLPIYVDYTHNDLIFYPVSGSRSRPGVDRERCIENQHAATGSRYALAHMNR